MKHKLTKKQNIKVLTGLSSLSFLAILCCTSNVLASSAVDEFTVTVPESCSLTSTVGTAHTATIENGVYSDDVGETTINAFCNDSEGFSVYAVGYTNDTFGNNIMKPSTLADTNAITTGLATSGDTSNWAMKLTSLSDNYTLTNDFNSYHLVPDEYTKVATYPSNTTTTAGVNIKSTYAAYISQTQPADTYTGKVKYTIVHPSNADAPVAPAMLDTGTNINKKMKNLANNSSSSSTYTTDYAIKQILRSYTLPSDFIATTDNTISLSTSTTPVYIFFDNTNDEGKMYYYAKDADIIAGADLSNLFMYLDSVTNITGLSNWNTTNVTNMSHLFYYCWSLANIAGLSNWDTSNVTDMSYAFNQNRAMSDFSEISSWETNNVTDMSYMFSYSGITNATALATGKNNNPNIWSTSNVTNLHEMFFSCSSLTDITGLSNWDTAKVTDISGMFYYTKITSLDALATGKNNNPNIWNIGNVTSLYRVFDGCTNLSDISGVSNWDTAKVTDMRNTFSNTAITNLNALVPNKNNNPNIWNTSSVTTMTGIFTSCSSLADITGVSNWDTANVTSMNNMFSYTEITSLDALVPNKNNNPNIWNTGNVQYMGYMFASCSSLADITGVSNWNTAKVTDMSYMFRRTKIANVDALATGKNNNSNIWNTGKVGNMAGMFETCSSLADITGLSNWDTAYVTDMSNMFSGDDWGRDYSNKITSLDALTPGKNDNPNIWNTWNVKKMNNMFRNSKSLTDISGITNWNTQNVKEMLNMFRDCTSLTSVAAMSDWFVFSVTATAGATAYPYNYFYQMFYNVPSAVTSGFVFTYRAGSVNSEGTYVTSS